MDAHGPGPQDGSRREALGHRGWHHVVREAFASILIDTGANPKAIQEVMGHSKTTYDIYGHLLPGTYEDVRARMDAYLADAA